MLVNLKYIRNCKYCSTDRFGVQNFNPKHNNLVTKNRHTLNRVIECLKFCGTHELAFMGHKETQESANRGNFFRFVIFTWQSR